VGTEHADEMAAKDRRIDGLVAQAANLVADLTATVTDMRAILAAAGAAVEVQQKINAERQADG
jgi:hypothetical protein